MVPSISTRDGSHERRGMSAAVNPICCLSEVTRGHKISYIYTKWSSSSRYVPLLTLRLTGKESRSALSRTAAEEGVMPPRALRLPVYSVLYSIVYYSQYIQSGWPRVCVRGKSDTRTHTQVAGSNSRLTLCILFAAWKGRYCP